MVGQRPAQFTVADLIVRPTTVRLGETASVSVLVTNTGDITGNCTLTMKVDGAVMETKVVSLAGAKNTTATFSITPKSAGEHTVEIGGASVTFTVEEAPPPPMTTEAPRPANFSVTDLTVTPGEVRPSEEVTISALVNNTGGSAGNYIAALNINNVEEKSRGVTLEAGESEQVTFVVSRDGAGKYAVEIGGNRGALTVAAPAPEVTPQEVQTPVQTRSSHAPVVIPGIIGALSLSAPWCFSLSAAGVIRRIDSRVNGECSRGVYHGAMFDR
jgi:uncharacterized protein YfaS (alpha-2-macroglobulin family)